MNEYRTYQSAVGIDAEQELERLASEGWEVVHKIPTEPYDGTFKYVLKRSVETQGEQTCTSLL